MIKNQSIVVRSALDVVTARMQVREMARRMGLSLTDQARISMATSSLASSMGLGENGSSEGSIAIECMQNGGRKGLKVICRRIENGESSPPAHFVNERWMVDEIKMQQLPPNTLEITLTKWAEA